MKVIAKKGTKCPMEHNPREYIYDNVPVEVPNTMYYQRLLFEGSLVLYTKKDKEEIKNGK